MRARLVWAKEKQHLDVELAQALKEKDSLTFEHEGTRYIGQVDQVMHAPVSVGSEVPATVIYAITAAPADRYMKSWVVWREHLRALFPKLS